MLQFGFGWYLSENDYSDLMQSMTNKYGKATIEHNDCPKCNKNKDNKAKFCKHCGTKLVKHIEIVENKEYDPESELYEYFTVLPAEGDNETFIGVPLWDLRGDNDFVSDFETEENVSDHLSDEALEIAKMICTDEVVKTRIFDDGYYNREWDDR